MNAVPKGWTLARISDLIGSKGLFADGDWVESKDQDPDGEVRLIQLADVGDGEFRDRSSRFLRPDQAERLGCTFLREGDLLVARMPDPLGRACIYPGGKLRAVTAVDVCIIRPANDQIDNRWLMWFLNAPQFRREVLAHQAGTTRKRISRKNLAALPLPVPPFHEQNRIVAAIEEQFSRLDAVERLLASARRRLDLLSTAIIDSAAEGFPLKQLGELIREPLRNGHSAKRSSVGNLPVFTLTAVTKRDFSERNTKLTDADPHRVKALWAEPGDIFVERSNTPELVGTAALYVGPSKHAIFPDLLIRVRVGSEILPEYAEIGLRSTRVRRYFQRAAKGIAGSMPKVDQDTVLAVELPIPPINDQRHLVTQVARNLSVLTSLSTAVDHALVRSTRLRRSILDWAFSGQLVPQEPSDEPATKLLTQIVTERSTFPSRRRKTYE